MPLEYSFRCPLENGMHARPASRMAELAGRWRSEITLVNERTEAEANVASVLDLVAAGVLKDDACRVTVSGTDEDDAYKALTEFIETELPYCDAPLPAVQVGKARIPRMLKNLEAAFIEGVAVSPGIGFGKLHIETAFSISLNEEIQEASSPGEESRKHNQALASVTGDIETRLARSVSDVERDILRATLAVVKDRAFSDRIHSLISSGKSAAGAVATAVEEFTTRIDATGSAYLRERVTDLQEIGIALIERLTGRLISPPPKELSEPSIVVAKNMAPGRFLALNRELLKGLVLSDAGATSHTMILARSMNIPALTGIELAGIQGSDGSVAVIDGTRGLLITSVTPDVQRFYVRESDAIGRRNERLSDTDEEGSQTTDGRRVELAANVATAREARELRASGAQGIGLFRTEMLFAERDSPPTEDEQFTAYSDAARAMNGGTVIVRTLDAGGDKPIPYLNLPREANPFLGYRGIRIYPDHPDIIDAQLRAVVRASFAGNLRVMAPMVATVSEAVWLRERVRTIQGKLDDEGVVFDPSMPVGIMVEIPAIALFIDKLRGVADFISIGTNDLCQYFFAADRGSSSVATLHNERHPAFLRLLKSIVDTASENGIWVGLCGEMAGRIVNLPLLVGLGLDEISMSAPNIHAIKHSLQDLSYTECRSLLEEAITCTNPEEVEALLAAFSAGKQSASLIAPELISLDSDCNSMEETIKELCNLIYSSGRTDSIDTLEDALWAREATFSTGLGHGFAIPHCKTDAIAANTIAIMKLDKPIEWGAIDDLPVSFVIMLAIRESDPADTHLRILVRLARKLMDEGFRETLAATINTDELVEFLTRELEIKTEGVRS